MPKKSIHAICTIDGCARKHKGHGLCQMHLRRMNLHGSPHYVKNVYGDDRKRFQSKIEMVPEAGCWIWTGTKLNCGYGVIGVSGKSVRAHRFSWALHNGEIPSGMLVLHKCDVPLCVNPSHLFLGTQSDNMRDMTDKGRSLRGEDQSLSKLTEKDVASIKKRLSRSYHGILTDIANEYGVTPQAIFCIKAGNSWKHI